MIWCHLANQLGSTNLNSIIFSETQWTKTRKLDQNANPKYNACNIAEEKNFVKNDPIWLQTELLKMDEWIDTKIRSVTWKKALSKIPRKKQRPTQKAHC